MNRTTHQRSTTEKEVTMHINDLRGITHGDPLGGGFYVGQLRIGSDLFALVVSPKAEGELEVAAWGKYGDDIAGALSCCDGHANTLAMAEAGSNLARWMLALEINGEADWYLGSRDEVELCYRNLKPSARKNACTFRDGDNPSSVPPGYIYIPDYPAQTLATALQAGAAEAFEETVYWTSTQYSAGSAWVQTFHYGSQYDTHERNELRARAVRRIKLDH